VSSKNNGSVVKEAVGWGDPMQWSRSAPVSTRSTLTPTPTPK
jgi:hypothetical protein